MIKYIAGAVLVISIVVIAIKFHLITFAERSIERSLPVEVDIESAKQDIVDLKQEVYEDKVSLNGLKRDIVRTENELKEVLDRIAWLRLQIEAGKNIITGSPPYQIGSVTMSREQVVHYLDQYVEERKSKRQIADLLTGHLESMRAKLIESEKLVTEKGLKAQEYGSKIRMLEIDAEFRERADRYSVSSGTTSIQETIDRINDKLYRPSSDGPTNVDFVGSKKDLSARIDEELSK
jgi:hypothetical protein